MTRDLFIRPGIVNFMLWAGIFYVGTAIYALPAYDKQGLAETLIFYTKFSWPNFLFAYLLFIGVIPYFLERHSYTRLFYSSLVLLALFVGIRYLNNRFWTPDYYSYMDGSGRKASDTILTIGSGESVRLMQFAFMAFSIRLLFEWHTLEIRKNQMENENLKAELESLRFQLSPHFLLNAMNNIYYMSMMGHANTPDAVMKLSELLRYILYERNDWVVLRREISYLESYLDFHRLRWPEDDIRLQADISEKDKDALIPQLIFVTFLENVFRHGKVGTKEDPVLVNIHCENGMLHYNVVNTMEPERMHAKKGGSGLFNLRRRVELIFHGSADVVTTINGKHYIAELTIPLHT